MTSRHSSSRAAWLLAALAALAFALAAARPADAAPAPACWQQVLRDWSAGAIARSHPVGCLREALRRMPEDMRLYSTAGDDISRALASRVLSPRTTASVRPSTASLVPTQGGSGGWPASLALAGALAGLGLLATAGLALSRKRVGRRR